MVTEYTFRMFVFCNSWVHWLRALLHRCSGTFRTPTNNADHAFGELVKKSLRVRLGLPDKPNLVRRVYNVTSVSLIGL